MTAVLSAVEAGLYYNWKIFMAVKSYLALKSQWNMQSKVAFPSISVSHSDYHLFASMSTGCSFVLRNHFLLRDIKSNLLFITRRFTIVEFYLQPLHRQRMHRAL